MYFQKLTIHVCLIWWWQHLQLCLVLFRSCVFERLNEKNAKTSWPCVRTESQITKQKKRNNWRLCRQTHCYWMTLKLYLVLKTPFVGGPWTRLRFRNCSTTDKIVKNERLDGKVVMTPQKTKQLCENKLLLRMHHAVAPCVWQSTSAKKVTN